MTHESKAGLVALRCPRCTWWTASTDRRRAEERGGQLFGQLVSHLMRSHALESGAAEQEATRVEQN